MSNIPGAKDQDLKPELKIVTQVTVGQPGGSLNNKATININEGVLRNDSGTLSNTGTISINEGGTLNNIAGLGSSNTGTIKINEGGTLNNAAKFSNAGTIDMAQGSILNHGGASFSNLATVTMGQSSAFNMSGGTLVNNGKFDMAQSSSFTINGGRLEGTGTITGTLNNVGGVVAPGRFNDVVHATLGTLNLGGYTQGANGALDFRIGTPQGFLFNTALNVTGPVFIYGGTISVSLNPGVCP